MRDRIRFFLSRLGERLWVKPLFSCVLSIAAAFLARVADNAFPESGLPDISADSLETLLSIISASMLVIAVFAVGSMLSAYASASGSATPRAFPVVVADDVSQYALSIFVGAFIFSIVGLIALMNGYYGSTGRFVLFAITVTVFGIVIIGFVRWVDRIARLGRLGTTIGKVEAVACCSLLRNRRLPTLGGRRLDGPVQGEPVYGDTVGYVQRVDVDELQAFAEKNDLQVYVAVLPGAFITPGQPLAHVTRGADSKDVEGGGIAQAFRIGNERTFEEDPRFGLNVLSEIASRALSPGINDPGSVVEIIDSFVRIFAKWSATEEQEPEVQRDRVWVPEVSLDGMFDDAFNAIAKDGAGTIEVMLRLQTALASLHSLGNGQFKSTASSHARLALKHAECALRLPEEVELVRKAAQRISAG
ncbi:DUF2254 domain-containing protein [Marinobacter sediminum]|uniref:DUF2254 domain-containing protein n=1 Tax=Marinobacter sediminum TaxID=256323 RepID=UPI00193A5F87|nr:DUF2254 domain-containing protein [Marinobacter sediminum]